MDGFHRWLEAQTAPALAGAGGQRRQAYEEIAVELAEQARNEAPEDYRGDDGLLYCGKCFTVKECAVSFPGYPQFKAPINCRCMEEAVALRREAERIVYVERIARTHWSENAKWFSQDNEHLPKVSDVCRRYVEQWKEMCQSGTGILFYGDVERGKPFMAMLQSIAKQS